MRLGPFHWLPAFAIFTFPLHFLFLWPLDYDGMMMMIN